MTNKLLEKIEEILELYEQHLGDKSLNLRHIPVEELTSLFQSILSDVVGEDEKLEPLREWLKATEKHGGTEEEYYKLETIINSYNNQRAEIRKKLKKKYGIDIK